MKNYKSLLLAGAVFASVAHAGKAIKVGQYFTGNYVDQDGRSFLHKFAQHSCGKEFVVKFDAFDFFENKLPAEMPKLKNRLETLLFAYKIHPDLAGVLVAGEFAKFANQKDNDGNTALDLARIARQEALDNGDIPHGRNESLIGLLEGFEPKHEELVELMESATN